MRVLRADRHRRMPWKNGGGETIEVAIAPPGAGIEAFDWRVSMALVAADGPFSRFAGIDRWLMILHGEGLALTMAGHAPVHLTRASPPLRFPADEPSLAEPIGGPVVDLNVMVRRSRFAATLKPFSLDGSLDLAVQAGPALLLCRSGTVAVTTGCGTAELGALDALLVDEAAQRWALAAAGPADLVLVEFRDVRPEGSASDGGARRRPPDRRSQDIKAVD